MRHITVIAGLLVAVCIAATAYAEDMKASVKVSGGGTFDYVVVGGFAGADDGLDNLYDTVSPGPNMNDTYIVTSIPHPEWGAIKDDFRADIRSADSDQSWVVNVSTNLPAGTPLSLDMDGGGSSVPEGYTLSVSDAETGTVVALDGSAPYEFIAPASGATKELVIEARYVAPVAEEPVAEEPVAEEPVAEEPVVEEPVVYEAPVAEDPSVTEESAVNEEDTSSSAQQASGEEVASESASLRPPGGGVAGGNFSLVMPGESRPTAERPARPVPPAPVFRERVPSASGGEPRGSFSASRSPAMTPQGGEVAYRTGGGKTSCKTIVDESGDTVIYCGEEMSQEEILRRTSRKRMPTPEGLAVYSESKSGPEPAVAQIMRGLKRGLNIRDILSVSGMDKLEAGELFMPNLFERFGRAISFRIAVGGMERIEVIAARYSPGHKQAYPGVERLSRSFLNGE